MQDSSVGLRSIIGRNVIVDADFWDATALVERCRNLDQLERDFSEDDRNQAKCHSRLYVAIPDDEIRVLQRDDGACEIDSNLNFASPIREDCWYGTISTTWCFVNTPAGYGFFNRGILPNPPLGWQSRQTMSIPWKVPLLVKVTMLWSTSATHCLKPSFTLSWLSSFSMSSIADCLNWETSSEEIEKPSLEKWVINCLHPVLLSMFNPMRNDCPCSCRLNSALDKTHLFQSRGNYDFHK